MTIAQASRRKIAALILAVTVGLCLASALALGVQRRAMEQAHMVSPFTAPLAPREAQISRIIIRDRAQTLTIARTQSGFVLRERRDHAVAVDRVRAFLRALDGTGAILLAADPATLAPFNLDDPDIDGAGIALTIAGAKDAVLFSAWLGYRQAGAGVFARRADQAAIFELADAPPAPNQPAVWLDLAPAAIAREAVRSVTVTPIEGPAYRLLRSDVAASFSVAAPHETLPVIAPIGVSATAHAFAGLAPSDVAPAAMVASARTLGQVQIETFAGLILDASVLEGVDGRYWITVRAQGAMAEATRAAVDINTRAAAWAYQITDLEARSLTAPLSSLVRYGR